MSFFLFYSGVTEPLMKREVDTKLERVKCQVNLISFTAAAASQKHHNKFYYFCLLAEPKRLGSQTMISFCGSLVRHHQSEQSRILQRAPLYVLFEILDDLKPIIRKISVLITSNEKLLWMNPRIKLWRIKWASFPKSSWDFQQNNFDW